MNAALAFCALALSGCTACMSPILRTTDRIVERDFSERADGDLLECAAGDYTYRFRVVELEPW